jgi:hypothetical protein
MHLCKCKESEKMLTEGTQLFSKFRSVSLQRAEDVKLFGVRIVVAEPVYPRYICNLRLGHIGLQRHRQ